MRTFLLSLWRSFWQNFPSLSVSKYPPPFFHTFASLSILVVFRFMIWIISDIEKWIILLDQLVNFIVENQKKHLLGFTYSSPSGLLTENEKFKKKLLVCEISYWKSSHTLTLRRWWGRNRKMKIRIIQSKSTTMTTVTQESASLECEHFSTFCFLIYLSEYVLPIITFARLQMHLY